MSKEKKILKDQNFTTTISVNKAPKEAYAAIKNIRGWWSEEIEGSTEEIGDEFIYRYQDDHYCKLKLTEAVPGKKVVWLILDNRFSFTKDKTEWKGTQLSFDISKKGEKTEVRFTHVGLVPEYECYEICSDAWSSYVKGSLKNLITKGKGEPNEKEKKR
jgi:hypothetical protein